MARKKLYKINNIPSNSDDDFADDNERFDDHDDYLEEWEKASPDILDYPDDIDEDDLDHEFKADRKADRKRRKKTRSEKFRYRSKYPLLPEREIAKQSRFYARRFVYKATALITGILALPLAFLAYKFNRIFAVLVLFIVIPGLIWGLIGLIKIRTSGLIIIIVGLALNVIATIMIARPLYHLIPNLGQIVDLIKDYFRLIMAS